jgi:hypothetical protein
LYSFTHDLGALLIFLYVRQASTHSPRRHGSHVKWQDCRRSFSRSWNQSHSLFFYTVFLLPDLLVRPVTNLRITKVRDLSLQTLGVGDGTDAAMWQRFDKFNEKYEPFGVKSLREIFLKHDNVVEGRFLAEITQEVISGEVSANNYVYLEPRLSIYGRSECEWDVLAAWVVRYNLISKRVKWMVQIPRIFRKIAESLAANDTAACSTYSFQTLLCNVFKPLFEVTQNPQSHPDLHKVKSYHTHSFAICSNRFI